MRKGGARELSEKGINAKKADDFDDWYTQVILKSELADYSPVSGCLVFRPLAYSIWEQIQQATDSMFKAAGIRNVYFPLLIPERLLRKEQQHVEGFAPEVAWVTETGETKLDERLAIRPTSETIMYESFSKWIRSWRDLPLRLNQWNNVLRWEFKHPTPFLRSREFLWNEGHTVFATREEAEAERDQILGIYKEITEDYLALPGVIGKKTESEKFAGAVASYSIEHLMPDGKAIQGPDFHLDGQNFARAFEISYLDREGKRQFAWQNTFAITTREIGVMVATHSDDRGLVIPPKVAPVQVVIVPIFDVKSRIEVVDAASKLRERLSQIARVHLDDRDYYTPGWKFNEWEMKGIPLRIELGPRDILSKRVVFVRRDSMKKWDVQSDRVEEEVLSTLKDIQQSLYSKAKAFLENNTHAAEDLTELKDVISRMKGFALVHWCESPECEKKIKEETGAKITNMPLNQPEEPGKCVICGRETGTIAYVARSY